MAKHTPKICWQLAGIDLGGTPELTPLAIPCHSWSMKLTRKTHTTDDGDVSKHLTKETLRIVREVRDVPWILTLLRTQGSCCASWSVGPIHDVGLLKAQNKNSLVLYYHRSKTDDLFLLDKLKK